MAVALTPMRFDEAIKVFFAVVVGYLLPLLNPLCAVYEYAFAVDLRFAVRTAGMIDVSGGVFSYTAVNRPFVVYSE